MRRYDEKIIAFHVPSEYRQLLKQYAMKNDVSVSFILRRLVKRFVDKHVKRKEV